MYYGDTIILYLKNFIYQMYIYLVYGNYAYKYLFVGIDDRVSSSIIIILDILFQDDNI